MSTMYKHCKKKLANANYLINFCSVNSTFSILSFLNRNDQPNVSAYVVDNKYANT